MIRSDTISPNIIVLSLLLLGLPPAITSAETPYDTSGITKSVLPVLKSRCVGCHGEDGIVEAELDFANISAKHFTQDAELVRKVIHALDSRQMPPEDEAPLTDQQLKSVLSELRSVLPMAIANSGDSIRTPIRRMNRFQYNNAVVDLFQLKCIVFTLPERAMRVSMSCSGC
ncbi:MAG: c-type cytochrome domain-containing protein [Planctomycetota bacterium]